MIERKLRSKRVLVVLDDVKQLEELAGAHDWFGEGSRIIITTRDKHLLTTRYADEVYEVSLLSHDEAVELFSRHAYWKDTPIEDYEMLSEEVLSYAGGLPLALEVLGSFLHDKDKDEWKYALARLKDIPDDEGTKRLKISYDGLKANEKELFLDIACCFRGEDKDYAMMVLDACDLHPGIGIKVLVQKSLIKVSDGPHRRKIFVMHDLIEEMAHNIVRGEHPKNPEKHSRILKMEDLAYLCDMGADAPPMETELLPYSHPGLSHVVANMKKLRWIRLINYPASSFPSNFQPTKLRCLMLLQSQQKELWEGCKSLPNLKILHLSHSINLITTPDFDGLPCLERLILSHCRSLEEIHPSIGYHKRLIYVDMSGCARLKRFPPIIHMKKLETLDLSGCEQLQQFPDIRSRLPQFPRSLRKLDLGWCNLGDGDIPSDICELLYLQILHLSCNKFSRLPSSLSQIQCLKFLDLSKCWKLVELPDLPSSIAILKAEHCPSLEIVRDLSYYKWLWKVSLPERTNKRVLLSMLEENAFKDRFMSVLSPNVQPSSIYTKLVTLQLPHNWYSDFSGLLLSLRARDCNYAMYHIVIKQEMSTDQSEKFDKDCREPYKYERVGYVPFSSLRHIPWFNPTYTKNISFQIADDYDHIKNTGLNVELVRSKSKIGDLNEHPIDYSECWDEEYEDNKTFEITYDSKSFEIQISWKH